jgi:transposase-like protein
MSEGQARDYLEKLRWPDGVHCVECDSDQVYKLNGESTRPGLMKCRGCKAQFSVTVGTVMEDSHLPLAKWVKAFHMMAASKKGVSALQLMRNLGLGSYKSAWHLAHRIRYAMSDPKQPLLKGDVQADECYIGGKPRQRLSDKKKFKSGRGTLKTPVVALIESGPGGQMHCQPVRKVTSDNLKSVITKHVDLDGRLITDDLPDYRRVGAQFDGGHVAVNHSIGQYVNADGLTTNTVEGFFALLKRGIHGTFHHVSKKHLHRYCDEFSFRWNGRTMEDVARRDAAIEGAEGKRLMYRLPIGMA